MIIYLKKITIDYKHFFENQILLNNIENYTKYKFEKLFVIYNLFKQTKDISYIIEFILPNLLLLYQYNETFIKNKQIEYKLLKNVSI